MTATSAPGIPKQLSHVALRVRDVDRAVDFYTQVVGLTLKNRRGNAAFLGIREDASHELALFGLPDDAADLSAPERQRLIEEVEQLGQQVGQALLGRFQTFQLAPARPTFRRAEQDHIGKARHACLPESECRPVL